MKPISFTLLLCINLIGYNLLPSYAQLSTPQIGKMAQTPLVYYRVGFVSKNRKLDKETAEGLVQELQNDPISEKYAIKPRQSTDGTYEIEMRMRIIFFDKTEAEKALDILRNNLAFNPDKFDLIVVEEKQ